MKIVTWNINGWRAAWQKGLLDFIANEQPDLLGLQETKINNHLANDWSDKIPGYKIFWHGAERPGYSGTAVIIKEGLAVNLTNGLNDEQFDIEGRCQISELTDFYWLNTYFPNANRQLSRLPYKQAFNQAVRQLIKKLEQSKPVIISGDFNVAHQPIDLANPKANEGSAGYTLLERQFIDQLLADGWIDIWRQLYPNKQQYTWWTYRFGARARNIGWRIDYFLISPNLLTKIKDVRILDQINGSDHCPVELIIV
jgi:exodeoxyribonuclease-3